MGGLTMLIPWSDLKGKPIQIEIMDVYLIAGAKGQGDYDYQQEFDAELKVWSLL
jgi:vacuolar protein sorting-associated protein 13A/C